MAYSDRGLGAQLEKRMPSLARKSMTFLRDVYALGAGHAPERPLSSQSFQPYPGGLSQHFNQGYQPQYAPQRPYAHSFSNTSQYPYSPPSTNPPMQNPTTWPYLSPVPPSQSYFPQTHSTPVSPIHSPQQGYQSPAPPPPAPTPAIIPPLPARPVTYDQPPSYDSIQQSSPPIPSVEQGYHQPWANQVPPHQQTTTPAPPPLPQRPSVSTPADHLNRHYQWQSPDSFVAVQEAEQHELQQPPPSPNLTPTPMPHTPSVSPSISSVPFEHEPGYDQQPQAPYSYQMGSAPTSMPHRPSISKPFPPSPISPYPGANQPHQAPYEQPASVSMPEQISTSTPEIAVTPAAVEMPSCPMHQYNQEAHAPQPYHAHQTVLQHPAYRPCSPGVDSKPPVQSHVPIPMMAELPG